MKRSPMKRTGRIKPKTAAAKRARTVRRKRLGKKAVGVSAVRKGPIRDAEHLARVRGLGCVACFDTKAEEAHHIREAYPRSMGKRIDDSKVVPLCRHHHQDPFWGVHGIGGGMAFWNRLSTDPRSLAAKLYAETLAQRAAQIEGQTP